MLPKLLLVDDREDNLLSIEAILSSGDYRFVKANSGRDALKILLHEQDFALILMDVQMPNLNGFETATLIFEREKLKHIPVIFITAHSYGDENIFKGYRTGAVDYIYKPINPEILRAKVSVFSDLYRQNRMLVVQEQKLMATNRSLEAEIAERKHSEEKIKALNLQLLQNIDRLEAANRELDQFAFMASHDLQEPLRKISTFNDRLISKYADVLDEEGRRYIQRIQNAAERMRTLINGILTFSKISNEKTTFAYTDLNPLLQEVIADFETEIREKQAQIKIKKLPSLDVNPVLMRPLFYNLISNALKYSKTDVAPEINIYAEFSPEQPGLRDDNRYCRIHVEDNGIGFEQKYSEEIFSMFKRLQHHSQVTGTGIGLALCKKIAEEHKGYISAISKVDEGSSFIISFPVLAEKKTSEPQFTISGKPETY